MAIQVIIMSLVVTNNVNPNAKDEFVTDQPNRIPIPNLPAGARLIAAWYNPLDDIHSLGLFDAMEVDVRAPNDIFLRATLFANPDNLVEVRARFKVYVLIDI